MDNHVDGELKLSRGNSLLTSYVVLYLVVNFACICSIRPPWTTLEMFTLPIPIVSCVGIYSLSKSFGTYSYSCRSSLIAISVTVIAAFLNAYAFIVASAAV